MESRKRLAAELAHRLLSGSLNENTIPSILNDYSLFCAPEVKTPVADPHGVDGRNEVGIWIKDSADGFVRDKRYKDQWNLWANVHRIPSKGSSKRIVFLGESVARGYFYDPFYTPALLLEGILNGISGNHEVIDLAKTNLEIDQLEELFVQSMKLSPDAVVVFAGNNWITKLLELIGPEKIAELAETITEHGIDKLLATLEGILKSYVEGSLDRMCSLADRQGIKLLFIIPEYNLKDFRSRAEERSVSRLPANGTFKYVSARKIAEGALKSGFNHIAYSNAIEMTRLDSSNPYGFELLGELMIRENRIEEARKNFEKARDTGIFFKSYGKPRILSFVATAIRNVASKHNVQWVDLRKIFKDHSNETLPGRELFMDYCHLTLEGIQFAMSATAKLILANQGQEKELKELNILATTMAPDKEVLGRAHVFAAIHNAHYGQSGNIIEHHCNEAVANSVSAREIMSRYVEMASCRLDSLLTSAYQDLVTIDGIAQYNRGILHNLNSKLLDIDLVNAMVQALRTVGIDKKKEILHQRIHEHGVESSEINLLESFYSRSSYEKNFFKRCEYFQANDVNSSFTLIANGEHSVQLDITYRVKRKLTSTEIILLEINDSTLVHLMAKSEWTCQKITVPAALLKNGVNRIVITWPVDSDSFSEVRSGDPIRTPKALVNLISPVLGEIHAFTATVSESVVSASH